jgi:hypothetical protein
VSGHGSAADLPTQLALIEPIEELRCHGTFGLAVLI